MSSRIDKKDRDVLREERRQKIKLATVSLVKIAREAHEDLNGRGELKPDAGNRIRKSQEVLREAITLGISGGLDLHGIIGGTIQPVFLRLDVKHGALLAVEEVLASFHQEEKNVSNPD